MTYMKNLLRISGLILSIFLISSCKKDNVEKDLPIKLTIVKGTVIDIDGNVYKTITLMKKTHTDEDKLYPVGTWMAENLKTTKYSNGELIGTTNPVTLDIRNMVEPSYQWPVGNNESNVATYGRLYTWNAATDRRNVCPTGWHVSTRGDWTGLNNFMVVKYDNSGTSSDNGDRLKEVGTAHWPSPNIDATDEIGFTALPTGSRNKLGASNISDNAYWWVNDYGWVYNLDYSTNLFFSWMNTPLSGFSIRCVKD